MRDRTREILSQHGRLSVAVDQLADDSDLYSAGLTSLATVGVMLALEDSFEIEFPDAMLNRKTFGSIESLVAAVEQLRDRQRQESGQPSTTRGSHDGNIAPGSGGLARFCLAPWSRPEGR